MSGARAIFVAATLLALPGAAHADPVIFTPPNCPFTLAIPPGMDLDPASVDTVDYHDGTIAVFGTWKRRDVTLEMTCYASPTYAIPDALLPSICNKDNPNLVTGSTCGPSPRFDGIESAWPGEWPENEKKSYWMYVAHKRHAGRLVLQFRDKGAAALTPAARARLGEMVKEVYTGVK